MIYFSQILSPLVARKTKDNIIMIGQAHRLPCLIPEQPVR